MADRGSAPSADGSPWARTLGDLDATGVGGPADGEEYLAEPGRTVTLLAETLGRLHALPVDGSLPVLEPPDIVRSIASASARVAPPSVEDPAYRHLPFDRLVAILDEGAGAAVHRGRPRVLTHGRPDLGRLRVRDGRAIGFDRWESAQVADPARDLAAALRSLVGAYGPGVVPAFAAAYPAVMPPALVLDWYVLADVLVESVDGPGVTT